MKYPKNTITIEQITQCLPQTQCGECGYNGCRPYASAILNQGETIDRCPPGGVATLHQLANLLDRDAAPYLANVTQKTRAATLAFIREDECIGCTKCIQACPVDAIIGAAKQMHTVLQAECTGCGLCVEPCPVDCIELHPIGQPQYNREKALMRFESRQTRLAEQQNKSRSVIQTLEPTEKTLSSNSINLNSPTSQTNKKIFIAEAIKRAKQKRKK